MASPQCENGYVRIANELLEQVYRCKLSGSELRVWLAIARLCYGFNKCRSHISITRLERETGLSRQLVAKALGRLEMRHMITVDRRGYVNILGIQKDYEKWSDSQTLLTSQQKATSQQQETKTSQQKMTTCIKTKDIYSPIFDYWNSKSIIKHRALTDRMQKALAASLKAFTAEEVCAAIDNYGVVLEDPKSFWNHRWTLQDFLKRGLDRFVDEARPLDNFRTDKKASGCLNASAPYPRSEMAVSTLDACPCPECREELRRRE
ncbi:MAG: replication protein [Candidatus Geothermincolia bacterium]